MSPGLTPGSWKLSSSGVHDVSALQTGTCKTGTLRDLVGSFHLPLVELHGPMKIHKEDLSSRYADSFSLPYAEHDPTMAPDALSIASLVDQVTLMKGYLQRRSKRHACHKQGFSKAKRKIQAIGTCRQEADDPRLSPAYVKLCQTIDQDKSNDSLMDEKDYTTVVVKNIPRNYTMDHLFQELSELGLGNGIDYMNMLEDKRGGVNRGYCFVNFLGHELALQCMEAIAGYVWKRTEDVNTEAPRGAASWALIQGFAANNQKHPMVTRIRGNKLAAGKWNLFR